MKIDPSRTLGVRLEASRDHSAERRGRTLQKATKRALDVALSLVLLVALLPLLAVIAVLIRLEGPGAVFFEHERAGKNGQPFRMYKFRTMVPNNDPRVHQAYYTALVRGEAKPVNGVYKIANDPRITRVGRVLRRFSLDELPQLINIVRGDMSLVGPRPALPYEVELYGAYERQRLAVPPGLTGLWQVSGRSKLGFKEMIELDLVYINGWSLWRDLIILLRTPFVVATGVGAC